MRDRNADNLEKIEFEEEQLCLDEIERTIDQIIEPLEERIQERDRELKDWHPHDSDEREAMRFTMHDRETKTEKVEALQAQKSSPYFCHFEASLPGEEPKSYFVSEKPLSHRGEAIVLDWRSPLGRTHANKTQKEFKVTPAGGGDPVTYELHLRRKVNIENAKLLEVITEFDSNGSALEGDIVDPFLLSVLRDKRRDHRLSDIIRTIQQSQNEIVERPVDESFVLQGCAGSGKTMILLHRLSFLVFNHPEVDFSKYVILTPNESFNRNIDELCEQLEIENISRYTVEGYYGHVVEKLGRIDTFYPKKRKTSQPKMLPIADALQPELGLDERYLEEIYSDDFLERVSNLFYDKTDNASERLNLAGSTQLFESRGLPSVDIEATPYESYRNLVTSCEKLRREADAAAADFKKKSEECQAAGVKLAEAKAPYEEAVAILEPLKQRVVGVFGSGLSQMRSDQTAFADELEKVTAELSRIKNETERLAQDDAEFSEEIRSAEKELRALQSLEGGFDVSNTPAVVAKMEEVCKPQLDEVNRIETELKRVGPFALGKKRRLRAELEEAAAAYEKAREKAFSDISDDVLAEMERERARQESILSKRLEDAREIKEGLEHEFELLVEQEEKLLARQKELTSNQEEASKMVEEIEAFAALFEESDYPSPLKGVDQVELRQVSQELADYVEGFKQLNSDQRIALSLGSDWIEKLDKAAEEAREAYEAAQEEKFSDQEMIALKTAESLCESFDVRTFESDIAQFVSETKKKYGVVTAKGDYYRHDAYLRALLCTFYYGSPDETGECACIDEAQDLSRAELDLIRCSLGADAVLNLYGDTNQSVYKFKGITDWNTVDFGKDICSYQLNENYRNTVQITDFCNQRLGMDMTAVGLSGGDVIECELEEGIASMQRLLKRDSTLRCVIICSYKTLMRLRGDRMLDGTSISFGEIKAGKISAISVEAAKGLEFDAVLAVEQGMTYNERYVAYTRALQTLYVVNSPDFGGDDPEKRIASKESESEDADSAFALLMSRLSKSMPAKKAVVSASAEENLSNTESATAISEESAPEQADSVDSVISEESVLESEDKTAVNATDEAEHKDDADVVEEAPSDEGAPASDASEDGTDNEDAGNATSDDAEDVNGDDDVLIDDGDEDDEVVLVDGDNVDTSDDEDEPVCDDDKEFSDNEDEFIDEDEDDDIDDEDEDDDAEKETDLDSLWSSIVEFRNSMTGF